MDKVCVKLCPENDCTGCGACAAACSQNAISMTFDAEGFPRPQINYDKCVGCNACRRICPVINPLAKESDGEVYAAWALDPKIRRHSSSGGLFTVLARRILRDGGCVVGASLNEETGFVSHVIVKSEDDLRKLQGSKYVQSCIDALVLKTVLGELKKGRKVLFSGTPCQVAGVTNLAKRHAENLFTIDIVCHGVPSPTFFARVHKDIKDSTKGFISYNFRELDSWSTNANVDYEKNGQVENRPIQGLHSFYLDAFLKGLMHRPNCFHCKYSTTNRVGDITLADFWGIGNVAWEDVKDGCSMVSVNTPKGEVLFGSIKSDIFFDKRDITETINGGNEQLVRSSSRPTGRDTFYKDAARTGYKQIIKKYRLQLNAKPTLIRRLFNKVRRLLG
ncbi:Coenzyme F420 hydrogenase/dehydrogenase, beta subunit C-terminal domain [Fibrobacter sp. UWB13]|uniref:Coenzyme F420 hydrogenase/dehydrogenase, beta subunit C-terminal domain n=1 Tax=Fibrobacter sp. UWB13 TaxID=1896204 RepID=UPI000A0D750B|nr:Coenzyme F420 hydrogenase/dehydrogenase, beta subunit C-terminal domain [Fibrobacter sp. UWB13]SMG30171.1 Coenzyme F420-reducing hydrogenase, beta subunit [Fibrobacter sp. UWB13]